MKIYKNIIYVAAVLLFISCGQTGFTEDAAGISAFGEELKDEFGSDAYYTVISVADSGSTGDIINVTVTEDPASNKMEEWTSLRGAWTQKSDITLELPEGTNATDYMFKLGDRVRMSVLGSSLEDAKTRLKTEKDIDSRVKLITINAPNDGDFDAMNYYIVLEPETGGTSFSFTYKLDGTFVNMDY